MKNIFLFVLAAACGLVGCSPDTGADDVAKAEAALRARDLGAAEKAFAAAARKDATNVVSQVRLAAVRLALGDAEGAFAATEAARAIDPDSAEALFVAGQAAYLKKDYKAACKAFDAVATAKGLPAALRANAFAARAVVDVLENRIDAARIALWRAVRLDPKCAAAWYHLAYVSRVTYDFTEAAQMQYQMAAGLLPASDARAGEITRKILPMLRDAQAQQKRSVEGASRRDPAASAKFVAEAQELQGKDVKKAEAKFRAAWEKDVFSFEAASGWARLASAMPGLKGDSGKILDAYEMALAERPNRQVLYLAAAQYALQVSKPIRAQRFLDEALAHDSLNKKALALYVDVLKRNGKAATAALYQGYLREL